MASLAMASVHMAAMLATWAEATAALIKVRLNFSLDALGCLGLEVRAIAAVAHPVLAGVAVMARSVVTALTMLA